MEPEKRVRFWRKWALAGLVALLLIGGCTAHPESATPTLAPIDGGQGLDSEELAGQAVADLAGRLGVPADQVTVVRVDPVDFADASLGVPEPGQVYAQVITPGVVIVLAADGVQYEYHGGDGRVVYAADLGVPNQDRVIIESVQIDSSTGLLVVSGSTTLSDGDCILTELWSDGEPVAWWPAETCAELQGGAWQLEIALGQGDAPEALAPEVTHMVRAFQRNGPDVQSQFAIDLSGPPTPSP